MAQATFEQNTATLREIVKFINEKRDPQFTAFARAIEEYVNEAELRLGMRDMKIDRLEKQLATLDNTLKVTLCPSCDKFGKKRGEGKCDCDKENAMWGRYVRREA